ncbi:MAG: hypothetical protein IAE95_05310 [Chitinophagaceae bacterium]|nr:hypothetical protein [Chitinophagaceae bacterium]
MQKHSAKDTLHRIMRDYPRSLKAEVAAEALSYGSDVATFFADLLQHGCQSGMIGKLIYYHDTHRFYDTYYDEIENLRYELEEAFGEPLRPQGDLKNWYAWMAFEEAARIVADELGL